MMRRRRQHAGDELDPSAEPEPMLNSSRIEAYVRTSVMLRRLRRESVLQGHAMAEALRNRDLFSRSMTEHERRYARGMINRMRHEAMRRRGEPDPEPAPSDADEDEDEPDEETEPIRRDYVPRERQPLHDVFNPRLTQVFGVIPPPRFGLF
jgi:hypothetical protein